MHGHIELVGFWRVEFVPHPCVTITHSHLSKPHRLPLHHPSTNMSFHKQVSQILFNVFTGKHCFQGPVLPFILPGKSHMT